MHTEEKPPVKKGWVGRAKDAAAGLMPRFSAPLSADRKKFSADVAQDKTKKQLRELIVNSLNDPEFVAAMDLDTVTRLRASAEPAPGPAPVEDAIPADGCDLILEGIGRGMMFFATKKGYTESQASVLTISDARKKAYIPRLVKIANKWLPAGALGKYEDEIMLLMAFTADTVATVKLMNERREADRQGNRAA